MGLVRIYQDMLHVHRLHVRGPCNVMQCNVAHNIFSRDFEFERICRNRFGKNITRHITGSLSVGEGPLECDAV